MAAAKKVGIFSGVRARGAASTDRRPPVLAGSGGRARKRAASKKPRIAIPAGATVGRKPRVRVATTPGEALDGAKLAFSRFGKAIKRSLRPSPGAKPSRRAKARTAGKTIRSVRGAS